MSLQNITGNDLVRFVKAGCIRLEHNRDEIDLLNVFPVPDGDTGTNMYLTLLAAVKEGEKNSTAPLGKVAKSISMGSLMGARGNSGVILSQVFRGIVKVLEGKEKANAQDLANALKVGSETAYKSVMKPVEGTILTVVREVAHACESYARTESDIVAVLIKGVEVGYKTLEKTPQMLPILKEAGVVDAGGQGFLYFLEGAIEGLAQEKDIKLDTYKEVKTEAKGDNSLKEIDIEFQYCTELLLKGKKLNTDDIKDHLNPLGDSMMVVGMEDIAKVHIHTNHPGKVLETCLQWGQLSDIKINNMIEEAHEHLNNVESQQPEPQPINEKEIGIVAVGIGEGIVQILESLGVDKVVQGGQTMNPSTEDLLNACEQIESNKIIILPNNSNIILAAEQVKYLTDKEIEIIPTKSIMQAITALIAYNPDGSIDEVAENMKKEIEVVKFAEITYAVRDTTINNLDIVEGDIIGIINGEISTKGSDISQTISDVLAKIVDDEIELITIIYGDSITEEEAIKEKQQIESTYSDYEIEMHYGGQPHYPFLLAVE
ncbi:Dihydroxyacetone kinase [Candidatus Syntrophocurvum alkaliphilum]|uniref:Dihydroxyacetone kinase n=1 Tax=Candidatus Syntrophocurvum alkaliphilum TaxID=2293317 RepID=A0A6I6DE84_9FIRM|nr:DAK2 domain-containing protein [Candidatus Syntrophocurvum alkaliphilum]QGT99072.1 Dihydroxyacetone kinase [Candidatus Syntrophocurvum alkaliphilum]